jgi:hypothetical protein
MEVGEVIQFYDFDKRFPAWGFGGKTSDGSLSHCFNLNGSASGYEVRRDYFISLICLFIFEATFWLALGRLDISYNKFVYKT